MLQYLKNIIPRIEQFSKKLDKIEVFVEKPWVLIDDDSNTHEYEFCRDGRLILSVNGNVTIGKWEFRTGTNRLLLDIGFETVLLQHAFINDALFILKRSGFDTLPFVFFNPNIVKEGNVVDYVEGYISNLVAFEQQKKINQEKKEKDLEILPFVIIVIVIIIGILYTVISK